MITLLLVSALGLGIANYMKKNNEVLSSDTTIQEVNGDVNTLNLQLSRDLEQVAYINPSCNDHPMNSSTAIDCSSILIRGGIIPLPGTTKDDVTAMIDFNLPSNYDSAENTLTKDDDSIRISVFNFTDNFNCSL